MKSIVIAALFASTNAVKLEWPSVARCNPGQISTDSWPCDDNSKGPHHLDGTQVQIPFFSPSMELEFRPPNPGHPLLDATQDRSPPIHGHVTTTPRDLTISMVPRFRLMVLIPFSSPLMVLESRPPNPGHPLLDATQDRSPPIHGHVTTTPRVHITLMEPSFNWSTDHQSSASTQSPPTQSAATGTISMRPTPETSQRRVVSLASPQPSLFR